MQNENVFVMASVEHAACASLKIDEEVNESAEGVVLITSTLSMTYKDYPERLNK